MGAEQPGQCQEDIGRIDDSRRESDANLLEGGARLVVTGEQVEQAREEALVAGVPINADDEPGESVVSTEALDSIGLEAKERTQALETLVHNPDVYNAIDFWSNWYGSRTNGHGIQQERGTAPSSTILSEVDRPEVWQKAFINAGVFPPDSWMRQGQGVVGSFETDKYIVFVLAFRRMKQYESRPDVRSYTVLQGRQNLPPLLNLSMQTQRYSLKCFHRLALSRRGDIHRMLR